MQREPFFNIGPPAKPAEARGGKCDRIFTAIIAGVFMFAAVAIICLQVFIYLYEGQWPSVSLIDLAIIFSSSTWLYAPHQWVGVHKILSAVPASLALIGIAYFIWTADK